MPSVRNCNFIRMIFNMIWHVFLRIELKHVIHWIYGDFSMQPINRSATICFSFSDFLPDRLKHHASCPLIVHSLAILLPADAHQVLVWGQQLATSPIPTGHFHLPWLGSEVRQGHLCLFSLWIKRHDLIPVNPHTPSLGHEAVRSSNPLWPCLICGLCVCTVWAALLLIQPTSKQGETRSKFVFLFANLTEKHKYMLFLLILNRRMWSELFCR